MNWKEKAEKFFFPPSRYVFQGEYSEEAEQLDRAGARISFALGFIGSLSLMQVLASLILRVAPTKSSTTSILNFMGVTGLIIYITHYFAYRHLQTVGDVMVRIGQAEEV